MGRSQQELRPNRVQLSKRATVPSERQCTLYGLVRDPLFRRGLADLWVKRTHHVMMRVPEASEPPSCPLPTKTLNFY